jgi:hypothetical protein
LMPIMIAVRTTPLDPEGSFFIVRRQALAALADEMTCIGFAGVAVSCRGVRRRVRVLTGPGLAGLLSSDAFGEGWALGALDIRGRGA